MDKGDNNIEDFFRKSMEQFGEAPTARVWEGLAQQLATVHVPFYRSIRFWIRGFIGICLVGLLLAGIIYSQNKHLTLAKKVVKLEQENLMLLGKIDSLNASNENPGISSISILPKNKAQTSLDTLIPSNTDSNTQGLTSSHIERAGTIKKEESPTSPSEIPPHSASAPSLSAAPLPYHNSDISQLNVNKLSKLGFIRNQYMLLKNPLSSLFTDNISRINSEPKAKSAETTKERRYKLSKLNLNFSHLSFSQARFGLTGIGFNSYLQTRTKFNPGYKIGIVSDFKLSRKLFLSSSLTFNNLSYNPQVGDFRNGAIVITLPDTVNGEWVQVPVSKYQSHIQSWDLNIGFKWYLLTFTNGNKLFLHPSTSIQRSQLLRTSYIFENQRTEHEYRGKYFAKNTGTFPRLHFFQSTQIQLGIERTINKQTFFQIGIWGHKRWMSYGGPGGSPSAFGIQAALLFSPKKNKGY